MRDTVSQPLLDIEESYFSKNTLFFLKNDFLFYYLKLYIPSVPEVGQYQIVAQYQYQYFLKFYFQYQDQYQYCP